ncbi:MAG: sulfatase [Chloroflexi bacterium]|nr:sulfatase [Chloroflexota bacterium]
MPSYRKFIYLLLTASMLVSCTNPLRNAVIPKLIKDNRPNILLIITDDQRIGTEEYMPETKRLIFDQGVTFSQGFDTTPFCCPSRSSIFTGMYAHNHGVQTNENKLRFRTFINDLHDSGYYTGLIGKYLNSWKGEKRPEFDFWVAFFRGDSKYYDPDLNVNGVWATHPGYITYIFRDYMLEFLDKAAWSRRPFLMVLAFNAPHTPTTPAVEDEGLLKDLPLYRPPSFNEADISDKPTSITGKQILVQEEIDKLDQDRRNQILTLLAVDRSISTILQKMKDTGQLDNTMIIFLSDNGKHWGEHRMDTKSTAYEESIRVPFALRYPPLVPTPYVENRLVANIDIAPTIYTLARLPIPATVDGVSLTKLFDKSTDWRSSLLLEAWPGRGDWSAIRSDDCIYIETLDDKSEFYDLTVDPFEMDNMIGLPQYQQKIAELKALLETQRQPKDVSQYEVTPIPQK